MGIRKKYALFLLSLLGLAVGLGGYYRFAYLPEKEREEGIKPLIEYSGLLKEEAIAFDNMFGRYAPYNKTLLDFAKYLKSYPLTASKVFELTNSFPITVSSLEKVSQADLKDTLALNFASKYASLVKDDGLNATDVQLINHYTNFPGILNKIIEKIASQKDRLFALNELTPYISKQLTEEQAYELIEKWYPELFKVSREKGINLVFGDADEDKLSNFEEIFKLSTDPLKPNLALSFALGKLPKEEALKFKETEYDSNSVKLIDLYSSLSADERNSNDVRNCLDQILADKRVTKLEKNLFDDKFVSKTLPQIKLEWKPVREVNDKIYDINVYFEAQDDETPIAYAELNFVPVKYEHFITKYGVREEDYPKAFPNVNDERVIILKPVDGEFDELREEFSADIKGIIGGGEYKIVAKVRDLAGNEKLHEVKTPYIREFENLGKLVYDKGIIVSSIYMPWDMKDVPMKDDKPLLGRYSALDDIVQWKHIDWATGCGINVFYVDGGLWESFRMRERQVLKGLMDKGMKAAILWGGHWGTRFKMGKYGAEVPEWAVDLSDPYNLDTFLNIVRTLLNDRDLFSHPNYHKVNGKTSLFIWDEGALINQYEAYHKLRALSKEITGYDLFIIADCIPRIPITPTDQYFNFLWGKYKGKGLQLVDAFSSWIAFHRPSLNNKEAVEKFEDYYLRHLEVWGKFTKEKGKNFTYTVAPGFDNSYSWGDPQIPLPRSPQKFSKILGIALDFLSGNYKEVRIDTWNDFGEWSYVEPTKKEGFTYLKVLEDSLPALKVYRALLSITTESDWTRVYIDGAVEVLNAKLIVKSGADALNLAYALDVNTIPPNVAIAKKPFDTTKVILNVQLILKITDHFGDLILTIQKGDLHYTRVDVYNSNGAEDVLVGSFINSIIDGTGINAMKFTVSISALAKGGPLTPPKLKKMVWAFYYPWYYEDQWGKDPTLIDTPLIGPYSSSRIDVIEKHIRMAKSSGIDGFIVSWWGPASYTDNNLRLILDVAKKYDFKVSIYLESLTGEGEARSLDQLKTWLIYFLRTYKEAEALYKLDEKPVIFVWAAQSHTPAEWAQVFSAVEKEGYSAKYIATAPMDPNHLMYDPSWIEVFDGLHNYGTVGIDKLDVIYRRLSMIIRTYPLLANLSKSTLWAPSISPGYDERAILGRKGMYQPREDGKYYQDTFSAALGSDPDWLLITSWNEFPENTYIEPSVKYGYRYLDLTALFTSQFKGVRLSPDP